MLIASICAVLLVGREHPSVQSSKTQPMVDDRTDGCNPSAATIPAPARSSNVLINERPIVRLTHSDIAYEALMAEYIFLNRFEEAKATFDEAETRKIDTTALRVSRAELAFLENDSAALKEQWNWALKKKGDAHVIIQDKSGVETYYGKFREAGRTLDVARSLTTPKYYNQTQVLADQAVIEAIANVNCSSEFNER
jgi:hypothetical protein